MNQTEKLLQWYDQNRRILPWREDPTPYHVWLSEIMLQQTRVEAVKEYYTRFLDKLPTIAALAAAPEDVYLKLWEGLGYYSRVRNLHKAAGVIMDQYGGVMPDHASELKKLPGIGEYTSAAIASIAFGESVPAIDGNLLRVFARMTGYSDNIKAPEAKKIATGYYAEKIPQRSFTIKDNEGTVNRPGNYNQALMDLGAVICLPNGAPLCDRCPWNEDCLAHQTGRESDLPVIPAKKARRIENRTVLRIVMPDQDAVLLHKRPAKGLLAGMYEFPNVEGHLAPSEVQSWLQAHGITDVQQILPLPTAKHIFTHIEWHMTGYEISCKLPADAFPGAPEGDALFAASIRELHDTFSVPSAFAAYTI